MINGTRFRIAAQVADQQRLSRSIGDLQDRIATGQRLSAPSDDPAAYARIATIRRDRANGAAAQNSIARASSLSSQADSSIGSAQQLMDRATETLLAAANGTTSADGRMIAADALRGIADDLRRLADAPTSAGSPLFGDSRGQAIPVGDDVIEAVPPRQAIFNIDLGGQSRPIADAITDAANRLQLAAGNPGYTATLDVDAFATAANRLASARSDIGFVGQRLEDLSTRLENREFDLAVENSSLADTDVSDAIARITAHQTTLQAAQAIFSRINQSGLFEMLN